MKGLWIEKLRFVPFLHPTMQSSSQADLFLICTLSSADSGLSSVRSSAAEDGCEVSQRQVNPVHQIFHVVAFLTGCVD